MKITSVKTAMEYTKFDGGLDLMTPPLALKPGVLLAGMNYEADPDGGYSRLDGYEIYSGQPSPSDSVYYAMSVVFENTVSVGDTVVGADSGATGTVIAAGSDTLDLIRITGTFIDGENFTVDTIVSGSLTYGTGLPVYVGQSWLGSDSSGVNFYDGMFYDMRVYNRIVTRAESTLLSDQTDTMCDLTDVTDGLTLHLPMTPAYYTAGSKTFEDISGTGNHGVSANVHTFGVDRKDQADMACIFDSSASDFIDCDDCFSDEMTISIRVKHSGWGYILSKEAGVGEIGFCVTSDWCGIYAGGAWHACYYDNLADDEWHSLIIMYDKALSSNNLKVLVDGSIAGELTDMPISCGNLTASGHATSLAAAADSYRADIDAPVGSGAIRGIGILSGDVYCFRDNSGATAGLIYKATASGWEAITLYEELYFDAGVIEITDGDTITVGSGAGEAYVDELDAEYLDDLGGAYLDSGESSALVKRVVKQSGTWGSTAAGKLIIEMIDGAIANDDAIKVGGVTHATAVNAPVQIALSPGGRYEIVQHNFTGDANTKRLYGADGVNRGFEFDGDIYVPIDTGMDSDVPEYVVCHKRQLFFSFEGSSQNSGIGTPYAWTVATGASEIGMGDNIAGLLVQTGDVLAIFTRNSTSQLTGANIDNFELFSISPETGAIPRTVQNIGIAYCLDDRGIINTQRSEIYGNFEQNTISRKIRSVVEAMRQVVVASAVYKSRNQYRLYGSDGTGICMTIKAGYKGYGYYFTQFTYPVSVACAVSGEGPDGEDVVYFGATNGKVYQANRGSSFDGEDIEAFIRLPFNNSKTPSTLKAYRKCTVEMTSDGYSPIRFQPDFSYGDSDIPAHISEEFEVRGSGGYWDAAYWESFCYDAETVANPSFPISGSGVNLGLIIYSKNALDQGHKLDGAILHYTPRRLVR